MYNEPQARVPTAAMHAGAIVARILSALDTVTLGVIAIVQALSSLYFLVAMWFVVAYGGPATDRAPFFHFFVFVVCPAGIASAVWLSRNKGLCPRFTALAWNAILLWIIVAEKQRRPVSDVSAWQMLAMLIAGYLLVSTSLMLAMQYGRPSWRNQG